ncbi:MAG: tRNA preQ1(34) S-adenosylmethionine ribosyltransferase-isomerase QueA [Sphaerochaetaceae bacterium]
MKTKEFYFNLPPELIAQYPPKERGDSRLLVLTRQSGIFQDSTIKSIGEFLPKNTLLVFNNAKVRKARLFATSETGGKVEFLFLYPLNASLWVTMISKHKRQHIGKRFTFGNGLKATVVGESEEGKIIEFDTPIDEDFFSKLGHIPLPPYIKRAETALDEKRYQTVYASKSGSVAAPTAGLHFTAPLLEELKNSGIESCFLTLHVGQGTFLPVRSENLEDHPMHREAYEISEESAAIINRAKKEKKRIVGVGTTSVRTLESAYSEAQGGVVAGLGSTRLFIYPPYKFKVVDGLVTNFHTPESTLLALVAALAGQENIFRAYEHAVKERYHFFSYGDAMLII